MYTEVEKPQQLLRKHEWFRLVGVSTLAKIKMSYLYKLNFCLLINASIQLQQVVNYTIKF